MTVTVEIVEDVDVSVVTVAPVVLVVTILTVSAALLTAVLTSGTLAASVVGVGTSFGVGGFPMASVDRGAVERVVMATRGFGGGCSGACGDVKGPMRLFEVASCPSCFSTKTKTIKEKIQFIYFSTLFHPIK